MNTLVSLALIFSIIALVFYITSSISYNSSEQGYDVLSWIETDTTYLTFNGFDFFNANLYGGLYGYMIDLKSADVSTTIVHSSSRFKWENGHACKLNGYATFGLILTALTLITISAICNIVALVQEDNSALKYTSAVISFISFICGVVGVAIFMDPFHNGCVHSLRNTSGFQEAFTYKYGPGSILATAGFGCSIFAFILNTTSIFTTNNTTTTTTTTNISRSNEPISVIANPNLGNTV